MFWLRDEPGHARIDADTDMPYSIPVSPIVHPINADVSTIYPVSSIANIKWRDHLIFNSCPMNANLTALSILYSIGNTAYRLEWIQLFNGFAAEMCLIAWIECLFSTSIKDARIQ